MSEEHKGCTSLGDLVAAAEEAQGLSPQVQTRVAELGLRRKAVELQATHLGGLRTATLATGIVQAQGQAYACPDQPPLTLDPGEQEELAKLLASPAMRPTADNDAESDASSVAAVEPKSKASSSTAPPSESLGEPEPKPGCLRGFVYPVSDGQLPRDYQSDPASTLYGCNFNIASPKGKQAFAGAKPGQQYAVRHQGAFTAPKAGTYNFGVSGNQGYRVSVGGEVVAQGQGGSEATIKLKQGKHSIKIEYIYTGGEGFEFELSVKPPGGESQPFSVDEDSPFYASQDLQYDGAERLGQDWQKLAQVQENEIQITQQIHFETGKANIVRGSSSEEVLYAVARTLEQHPRVTRLEVQGYTDSRGDDGYNQELSERRAQAVRLWLVNVGIEPHRLVARGYGKTSSTGSGAGAERVGRRVQFVVLEQAAASPGGTELSDGT